MNKKQKSSIILASLATIAVSGSLIAGATYALFTSESKTNIAVSSGKVDVSATISEFTTYTGKDLTGVVADDEAKIKPSTEYGLTNGNFANGGTATYSNGTFTLDKMTPGDKVEFKIKITNNSTVAIKYRTIISFEENTGLYEGLAFNIDGTTFEGLSTKSAWKTLTESGEIDTLDCFVYLPSDTGNDYQDTSCKVSYTVEAVQGNAATTDPVEGVIEIDNAAQLKFFRDQVNKKTIAQQKAAYNGKTIQLTADINLNNEEWTPIYWGSFNDSDKDESFKATFNGNGKTIKNFKVTKANEKYAGLFAIGHFLTITDLNIDNATIQAVNGVGAIVGLGYDTKFDGCSVTNSSITASTWKNPGSISASNPEGWDDGDKAGAIAGRLQYGSYKITNCTVSECSVRGYRDVGGLVGYIGNADGRGDVTNNLVEKTTITNDRTHNYKNYSTESEYDVHEVIGEKSGNYTEDGNTDSNVTINFVS